MLCDDKMNNDRALRALCRVAWPECSTGWRRSSQSGVDRETPGLSTSSPQSPGSIQPLLISERLHVYPVDRVLSFGLNESLELNGLL